MPLSYIKFNETAELCSFPVPGHEQSFLVQENGRNKQKKNKSAQNCIPMFFKENLIKVSSNTFRRGNQRTPQTFL